MPLYKIVSLSRVLLKFNVSKCLLNKSDLQAYNTNRFISTSLTVQKPVKTIKNKKEKVRLYITKQYIDYVKNYMKVLETRFPTAMRMYKVFSIGIKDFLRDLKTYISLRLKVARDQGFTNMSRKDIELYQKMPADMLRIAPVLLLSAVPFGNYVIFPLALLKPKLMLSSHFWSIQQQAEFNILDLKNRFKHNKPVFRALQASLEMIPDDKLKTKWSMIVAMLGSGLHPTPEDVLECKDLFAKNPYDLSSLTYAHLGHLLNMHGLRTGFLRRKRLKQQAFLLLEMDKAIIREGGVEAMNQESLRLACYIRGLNSCQLNNQELKEWLNQWLTVSQHVNKETYSLILHCPILLAYNQPQNWVLIH